MNKNILIGFSIMISLLLVISFSEAFLTIKLPDVYEKNTDSFGIYYNVESVNQHNSPSMAQSIFAYNATAYNSASAFMLKSVKYPSGAVTHWDYELDDWFTSRGDVDQPFQGIFNYYSYWRHDGNPTGYECESNYGGGIRVANETKCDGLQSDMYDNQHCYTVHYYYTMSDPLVAPDGCTSRSSGAIDFVPLAQAKAESVAKTDQDIRRPSHKGGPYVTASVMYNQVKVQQGDGSQGYQIFYYTTVDSNPQNTYGAIDFEAKDDFSASGDYFTNYDTFGSEAAVNEPWKRGLEYMVESYDKNGKLVSKLKRYYKQVKHFEWDFGDTWREDYYPGIGGNIQPVSNTPDYKKDLAGFASGYAFITTHELTMYDSFGRGSFTKTTNFDFDEDTGFPTLITQKNTDLEGNDKSLVKEIKLAYKDDVGLEDKHLLSAFESIEEKSSDKILTKAEINYKNFDGQYFSNETSFFNEVIPKKTVLTTDYSAFGNPKQTIDPNGNIFYSEYDNYGRLFKSWNEEYGSEISPVVEKEYDSQGFLESTTNINNETTKYYYEPQGRISKIVQQGDTLSNPTIEYTYNKFVDKSNPESVEKKVKIDDENFYESISFYDGFGKTIETQEKRADGKYLVTIKGYNKFGELEEDYKPVVANTEGKYKDKAWLTANADQQLEYTKLFYNEEPLRRLKQKTKLTKAPSVYGYVKYTYGSYNGFPTITVEDENGQFTRYTYDLVHKNILKVEQGKLPLVTQFIE